MGVQRAAGSTNIHNVVRMYIYEDSLSSCYTLCDVITKKCPICLEFEQLVIHIFFGKRHGIY